MDPSDINRNLRQTGLLVFPAMLVFGVIFLASPAGAATLSVSSATVSQPGELAMVCVTLDTEGRMVAGTQNDLIWDGTCATLTPGSCEVNSGHGKSLNTAFPADFTLRALVLSLGDVNPIGDTELYCCSFRSEVREPGACCPVSISRVQTSDPNGNSLPSVGRGGKICLAAAAREPAGRPERPAAAAPPSAEGGATGAAPEPAPAEPAAPSGQAVGGLAPATDIVMPGGGEREEAMPEPEQLEPAAKDLQAETPSVAAPLAQPPPVEPDTEGEVAAVPTPRIEISEPTPAITVELPTTPSSPVPTAPDTPTAKLAPTTAPPTVAVVTPPSEKDDGWGCQVATGDGTGRGAIILLVAFGVLLAVVRRRSIPS